MQQVSTIQSTKLARNLCLYKNLKHRHKSLLEGFFSCPHDKAFALDVSFHIIINKCSTQSSTHICLLQEGLFQLSTITLTTILHLRAFKFPKHVIMYSPLQHCRSRDTRIVTLAYKFSALHNCTTSFPSLYKTPNIYIPLAELKDEASEIGANSTATNLNIGSAVQGFSAKESRKSCFSKRVVKQTSMFQYLPLVSLHNVHMLKILTRLYVAATSNMLLFCCTLQRGH